ncbi:hypothetical protein [Acinetobacter towneri]|uniref:hypothetical protein n=1 Tax=Acinetobacter towneri TaxID=202956 RepID=UPI000361A793|nr:hypothetical protein [Acinetobacter towneri]MCO8058047.1 hypothetical protein [Acinetobacter towneri]MCO8063693.1 hypothetical protein [Acinetobacter towneri]WOE29751.1 hypothetical protein QSG83_06160 [Acinetobacter towneri]
MSILLVVMLILATIHYFYQFTVVKTNNELFDADLAILQHEIDIFEIKNSASLNASETEFLAETKNFVKDSSAINKHITFVEMVMDIVSYQSSNSYKDGAARIRSLKIQNGKIWNYNVEASRHMVRNAASNAGLFLFGCSPVLFLVVFYSLISGNKLSFEQSVERLTSKHC